MILPAWFVPAGDKQVEDCPHFLSKTEEGLSVPKTISTHHLGDGLPLLPCAATHAQVHHGPVAKAKKWSSYGLEQHFHRSSSQGWQANLS